MILNHINLMKNMTKEENKIYVVKYIKSINKILQTRVGSSETSWSK